jgi:cephalosporin-C deacetylase
MIPPDLEAFWDESRRAAAATPLDLQTEPVTESVPYEKFRLTYRSLGNIPVRAYLARPIMGERDHGRLPAIVIPPGLGGWEFGATLAECQRGYVVLQVYPRSQGESGDLWKVDASCYQAWMNHGKHDRAEFYYRGGYLDLVRGIDCLLTRPDVDPERIGVLGTSQGGGMALAVGAIDRRVQAVVAHVPYLCDVRHNAAFATWPGLGNDPVFLDVFDYFDPVHLVPWLRAPTLISSGGRDPVCPPDTIRAVFDRVAGIKALAHFPDLSHSSSPDFYGMTWDWLRRYLS